MANSRSKTPGGPPNVGTKKQYGDSKIQPVNQTHAPRFQSVPNGMPKYSGQMDMPGSEKFADPMNMGAPAMIYGLEATYDDIGEKSGFICSGYLDKGGTPFGEAAKFNYLPPGMDISNQMNAEINEMPLRKVIAESYPGDGWMPAPRDIPE